MISRSLHVLVADEKEDVVDALRQYLIADGHSVMTSLNGRDALEKFLGNRFDVVITGRSMPEMTGQQLLAAIHRNAPQKPIIMMTGSADRVDDIPVVILPKPVTISALREAVVEALGA
jgi:DNA-binding NtrC family response regulator